MTPRAGADPAPLPDIAVVVLSVGAPPELRDAVASLQRQSVPVEVTIVNSGGGDLTAVRSLMPEATIVEVAERLWPGAARNRGIAATRAPLVAFMASDHILTPGWAAARLARHRAGHATVACAVINSDPQSLVAWAHHLSILVRRLPGVPISEAGLYGVSYDRVLFERHGLFREDLRIGEDTEFNGRLPPADKPVWAPEVQTIHRNTTSLVAFCADQFRRGQRSGYHWPLHKNSARWWTAVRRYKDIATLAPKCVEGEDLRRVKAARPILFLGTACYGVGLRRGYRARIADGITAEAGPAGAPNKGRAE